MGQDFGGGAAGVDDDDVPRLDEGGGGPADLLLLGVGLFQFLQQGVAPFLPVGGVAQLQFGQVPAHRHLRHRQPGGQGADGQHPLGGYYLQQKALPLFLFCHKNTPFVSDLLSIYHVCRAM